MKTAEQWIESIGIPLEKGGAIRFVAEIQEDAVRCYETTAAIEEVESAFEHLKTTVDAAKSSHKELRGDMNLLGLKISELSKLKVLP